MAPRKFAAVGEEDGPTLTLTMGKGPLSGQINEFRPGSKVQIGRLVRGNTLSIKDAGISSKHILFQFDAAPDPSRRRWTITDLGSSNGTILNGAQLEPSQPVALCGGDVVKIGEQTSIKVSFEVIREENEVGSRHSGNLRRNARRRVREPVVDLRVIEEDAELGLRNDEIEEKKDKAAEIEAKQRNVSTRSSRNSAKINNLAEDLNGRKDKDMGPSGVRRSVGVSTRRTRNATKQEKVIEIGSHLIVIEDKKVARGRRGRKKQDVQTTCVETEKEEPSPNQKQGEKDEERSRTGVDELGRIEGVAAGTTSSSRVKEPNLEVDKRKMVLDLEERVDKIGADLVVIQDKKPRRGGRGRKKQDVETICEESKKEESNPNNKTHKEEEEISRIQDDEAGIPEGSGVKQPNLEADKGKMVPDLEKMSLGEWLDFLDLHEPQEIIDQTEAMLAEMRRKAEKCHEFRLQHKNAKGKGAVAVD